MVEPEREDRVARLQHGEVHRHVRLRARVRLDVRVLGAEELLRAVDRELLDLVDDLAAAVVAPARVPLGVLVRRHAADRLEHGRPGEVLRRDQLDLAALPVELPAEQPGDLRVELLEALASGAPRSCAARRPSVLLRAGFPALYCRYRSAERSPEPPQRLVHRRRAGTEDDRLRACASRAPSTRVPGSSPPSSAAPTASRSLCGTSASVRGSGPPGRFALVAASAPTRVEQLAGCPCERRHPDADRGRPRACQPTEPPGRVREHERVAARAGAPARSSPPVRRAPGCTRAARRGRPRRAPSAARPRAPSARYSRRTASSSCGVQARP